TVWWRDFLAVGDSRSSLAGNTFAMLGGRWFLGVGPGNFARIYPMFVDSPLSERPAQPGNFLVETLALGGVLTFAALVVALGCFARKVWADIAIVLRTPLDKEAAPTEPAPVAAPPWEFYVGGVIGLTVTFVLQVGGLNHRELLHLAGLSAVRSLVWLGAFALFDAIPWQAGWRLLALGA